MSAPKLVHVLIAPDRTPVCAFTTYAKAAKRKASDARVARKTYGPFMGNRKLWDIRTLLLR